jgi:glycosyltransferase involved in cell wall biosynthesis
MNKFTFHVLGVPHTKTNLDYTGCAFTMKAWKFCKMMTARGHTVYHYGVEGSCPDCTENINVVSKELYDHEYANMDYKSKWFKYDTGGEVYQTFFKNTIAEIDKRRRPHDFLLPFWGQGVRPICDAEKDKMLIVEPGIGYPDGGFAPYRVFESEAVKNGYYGMQAIRYCQTKNYDRVIPNYFDLDEFYYNNSYSDRVNRADPYFAFVGRIYDGKGINIALQVCEKLGIKLKVAGQLDTSYENYNWGTAEYIGYVNSQERSELMSHAIATFVPSQYTEPFGGVQVEALLCGTPTITSANGAFCENNIEGVTGYRCVTFDDYLTAALNCLEGKISYAKCRQQGLKFSLENVAPQYERYFQDIMDLYEGDGWYTIRPETASRIENLKIKTK